MTKIPRFHDITSILPNTTAIRQTLFRQNVLRGNL